MSYKQAVYWLIQNRDTAWVDGGKLSVHAGTIADLFKKSHEALRDDVRATMPTSEEDWKALFSPDYRGGPLRPR